MKRTLFTLAFLALLPIGCFSQTGDQSNWNRYKPRTLQSIIDAHQEGVRDLESDPSGYRGHIFLTAESFPSTVTLVYQGKSRPLEGRRQELLKAWAKMMGRTEDLVSVFGKELLFKEGDNEFWIAVQKPLLDPLPKEVTVGKQFTAYVIWMGAITDNNRWEWLFAMNEFDAPTVATLPTSAH